MPAPSTTTAPAGTSMLGEGKQAQLLPERPSKPPPSRLRPPRPRPLQLACDESTSFCRSPVANSPQKRPVSASLTSLPGREPADRERVSPGDVQSPPTPRLSAVLTAELFNGEDMDQISLWSRLEEGEETLCQPLPQTHVGNCSARSLSSVHEGDSLEISSLTAALDNSNADHDSFNHCRSSSPPHQKQQAVAASRTPPWPHGSPGDASTHMSELRRLRQEIESNHVASETCETSSSRRAQSQRNSKRMRNIRMRSQSRIRPLKPMRQPPQALVKASTSRRLQTRRGKSCLPLQATRNLQAQTRVSRRPAMFRCKSPWHIWLPSSTHWHARLCNDAWFQTIPFR